MYFFHLSRFSSSESMQFRSPFCSERKNFQRLPRNRPISFNPGKFSFPSSSFYLGFDWTLPPPFPSSSDHGTFFSAYVLG